MLFAPDWKRETAHQASTEPPPSRDSFARWAAELLSRGEHDEALRRAEIGTQQFPEYATGWFVLARAQAAVGLLKDAAISAERCLSLEPEFFACWDLLAQLWERLNRPAAGRSARARLAELLGLAPQPETPVRAEPEKVTAVVEARPRRLTLTRPTESALVFETPTLAEVYRRQGLLDRALEVYSRILERHPDDAGARAMVEKLETELSSRRRSPEHT
jgi:tetratricopeptide (TPR) repeat protein